MLGKIKLTKQGVYWICVFAVVEIVLFINTGLFLPSSHSGSPKWLLLFLMLHAALLLTLFRVLVLISTPGAMSKKPISIPLFLFCFIVFPPAWHFALEFIDNRLYRKIDFKHNLVSIAICAAVFLILFFLFHSLKAALWSGTIFYFVFGCVEYYVIQFKGAPVMFSDLLDAGAALAVVEDYQIRATAKILVAFVLLFVLCMNVLARGDRTPWGGLTANLIGRAAAVGAAVAIVLIIGHSVRFSKFVGSLNVSLRAFHKKGTQLCFIQSIKNAQIQAPEGYSVKEIESLAEAYTAKAKEYNEALPSSAVTAPDRQPNIIAIMNESFSNIDLTGQDGLAERIMPNVCALTDNTIKGYTMVSTYGGGTCRSEYEFNTGDSMHIFKSSASPYALFGGRMKSALASQLLNEGYRTVAIHPYKKTNYNRPRTYSAMGFQEFLYQEDFEDPLRIRKYISDEALYDKIVTLINETDEPLFNFSVTMQNHGPYTYKKYDVTETVGDGSYAPANQFVSLIKDSDAAFAKLIENISKIDEPTIVVMFGDHLPNLSNSFYQKYNGFSTASKESAQHLLYYMTPYVIWANYDIPEATDKTTSLNYLGVQVLELAGSKLTGFQMYLKDLMEKVPAYSQKGWTGQDGMQHPYGTDAAVESAIDDCDKIIYNELIDKRNRCDSFYQIPEDVNG